MFAYKRLGLYVHLNFSFIQPLVKHIMHIRDKDGLQEVVIKQNLDATAKYFHLYFNSTAQTYLLSNLLVTFEYFFVRQKINFY